MIKSILILAQCLPLFVLAQGQVTIRIPTCDPGLGATGTLSGEPSGATGLVSGASGGESAPGSGSVPGGGSSSSPSPSAGVPFVVTLQSAGLSGSQGGAQSQEAAQYPTKLGGFSYNPAESIPYTLNSDGTLSTPKGIYSVPPGTASEPFVPGTPAPGAITGTWSINPDGTLSWINPAFTAPDNAAAFYMDPSGTATSGIIAVFDGSVPPAPYVPVELRTNTASNYGTVGTVDPGTGRSYFAESSAGFPSAPPASATSGGIEANGGVGPTIVTYPSPGATGSGSGIGSGSSSGSASPSESAPGGAGSPSATSPSGAGASGNGGVGSPSSPAGAPSVPAGAPSAPVAAPSIPAGGPPSVPAAAPSTPAAAPTTPAAAPSAPAANPSTPAAAPSSPAAAPSSPAAAPSAPAANPSTPAAAPSVPAASPSVPAANPSTAAAAPSVPAAPPSVPAANPSTSAAAPSVPAAAPLTPTAVAPTSTPGTGTGTGSGTGSGSGSGTGTGTGTGSGSGTGSGGSGSGSGGSGSAPNCTENTLYANYFSGTGFEENPTNPGNPTGSTTSPDQQIDQYGSTYGQNDTCGALDACINSANYYRPQYTYQSFDLHYIVDSEQASQDQWICVLYLGNNTDPTYFNTVPTETYLSVTQALGYYLITAPS